MQVIHVSLMEVNLLLLAGGEFAKLGIDRFPFATVVGL